MGVEDKLQAAEAALQGVELNEKTRDLIGQMAAARATLAVTRYELESMLTWSRRALEYLSPDNLPFRFTAYWTLSFACLLQGDRAAAKQACLAGLAISQKSGDVFSTVLASSSLGELQEFDNQLVQAAETYRRLLPLFGDHPQPNTGEVYLALARLHYEWNDLETAERYGQQGQELVRQYDQALDRFIISEVFLARLKLAQGDVSGAAARLVQTEEAARQNGFVQRLPEVAAARVVVLLRQGEVTAAAQLVQAYELPLSQARVLLAQGDSTAALAILESVRQQMEARNWQDELLKTMIVQAVALRAHGAKDQAVHVLGEALTLAEPGNFIRSFVDEGEAMRLLILDCRLQIEEQGKREGQKLIGYIEKLLAAFPQPMVLSQSEIRDQKSEIIEPLSPREVEILRLIAQGLSNREVGERLHLALDTVKGHNRRIFDKLEVKSRTEAIARARELGLL
jgi:LuxR family maltose regulon positive regulatory protein